MLLWTRKGWNTEALRQALETSLVRRTETTRLLSVIQEACAKIPFPSSAVVRIRGQQKRFVIASVEFSGNVNLVALTGGYETPTNVRTKHLEADLDQLVLFSGSNARKLSDAYHYYLDATGNAHLWQRQVATPAVTEAVHREIAAAKERKAKMLAAEDARFTPEALRTAAIRLERDVARAVKGGHGEDLQDTRRKQDVFRSVARGLEAGELPVPWHSVRDVSESWYEWRMRGKPLDFPIAEWLRRYGQEEIPGELDRLQKAQKIAQLEEELGLIPSYFPTPRELIAEVIEKAEIMRAEKVLEPSAGKGNLAEAARAVGGLVDVVELNGRLAEILNLKGFAVIGRDFLEMTPKPEYDVVVMNPPFEKDADAEHVRHAFGFLRPGGTLVAIMSEGPFFRAWKSDVAFREWLEGLRGETWQREAAFKQAERQTGVRVRVVRVKKPAERPNPLRKNPLRFEGRDPRPDSDYDPRALAKGIKVEMEHTRDPAIAKVIAKDHLDERGDYYDWLELVEKAPRWTS